jgi:hypothetical protein
MMKVRLFIVSAIMSLALLLGVILLVHASRADKTQAVSVSMRVGHADSLPLSNQQIASLRLYSEIAFTPVVTVYLPVVMKTPPNWAWNNSFFTTCAEADNVNVPLFAPGITSFRVIATHPKYDIGTDNCIPDFSGCSDASIEVTDICAKLHDDGTNVVEGCVTTQWWRTYTMNIVVGTTTGSYHYLRLYRKIQEENSWPQFLVLYEDGNMRLKPHPPMGRSDTCFGSSVIIGPAIPSERPYVDVQEVRVNPSALTLDMTYRDGGIAHVSLSVSRVEATASVNVGYSTSITIPFAILRSMYVSDGNADVDHIQCPAGDFPILTGWTTLEGPWWFFHRTIRSVHNTSAPDVRIEVLD